jgi:hypothetical protein
MIDEQELKRRFIYHHSTSSQSDTYNDLSLLFFTFAKILTEKCPEGREQSLMITALEETEHWAFASISRQEGVDEPPDKTDEVVIDTPMGKAKRKLKGDRGG